jgi:hypothetical protein
MYFMRDATRKYEIFPEKKISYREDAHKEIILYIYIYIIYKYRY